MQARGETDHCRARLSKYCMGQGLDLGCGAVKITANAIGIDLTHPEADMHADARDLSRYADNFFDFVYSSSLLEELQNTEASLKEWLRVLKPGGYLVLYQADRDFYYPIGDPRCNGRHIHHFIWEELWNILRVFGNNTLTHSQRPINGEWNFELVVKKVLEGTVIEPVKDINFKFMVVGGPAEAYIERCLESIRAQSYPNWTAQVVLDPMGDDTFNRAIKHQSDKIKIVLNDARKYNISNFLKASDLLQPSDEDVLIMLDADDWLTGPDVLTILKSYYDANPYLLLTHGSWRAFPNPDIANNNIPYTKQDFEVGIRNVMWRASHLKTFKHKVWKNVKKSDLMDDKGSFYTMSGDLAMIYPMLEMAGYDRVKFIPEILCVYNQETAFSDEKMDHKTQTNMGKEIQKKCPYPRLEKINTKELNLLIFSKDRGCQLELYIRSMKKYFKYWEKYNVKVLYTFSNAEAEKGYEQVKALHPDVALIKESSFKTDVLSCIDNDNEYTMFGVDDNLFIGPFDLYCPEVLEFKNHEQIYCLSLRMHPRMNYCYVQDMKVSIPNFEKNYQWLWEGLPGDWGYPLSEDFHLFRTSDIIGMHRELTYKNPNTLEGQLASLANTIKRPYMACFGNARVINIPANKVQDVNNNRHGDISADDLNQKFLNGERIVLTNDIPNHFSPHVEYTYLWEKR